MSTSLHFLAHGRKILGRVCSELPTTGFILQQHFHFKLMTGSASRFIVLSNIKVFEKTQVQCYAKLERLSSISFLEEFKHRERSFKDHLKHLSIFSVRGYAASAETVENANKLLNQSLSASDLASEFRIKSLATKLDCSVSEMRCLIIEHPFLIHMDLDLIENKINLLLSYNLPISFAKQHLRIVYQTSSKVLEERLQLIKDSGFLHLPFLEIDKLPHMLECKNAEFSRAFKYKCDQRNALEGCKDQLTYLQMRLGCSEKTAKAMLCSYPLERRISNVKLKNLLDFFLLEAEQSPDFVIANRKLLTFALTRLRQRWLVIKKSQIESEAQMVYIWCMAQKDFEKKFSDHLNL
ncbi:transcription termination factor, mitochondrial [Plakobranchus ocellatus]|uniref:Transcription termination factor, mitochondrial n=1 Tax=Plakobranchus ocellatus TaxID=259542 RepID=A0AAV4CVB8_9GAST|nr:transcription termination factor, mitochondrial [Plakobranchus ocellatus]